MASTRLSQLAEHLTFKEPPKHPLDPLDSREIAAAVAVVRAEKGKLYFNTITLLEPRKKDMLKWLEDTSKPRPPRVADVIATTKEGQVHDIWVDLGKRSIVKAEIAEGIQPTLIVEEMLSVEEVIRKDPGVIEQCGIIGIPPENMHKVYCDPWTITHDPKYGTKIRAIQALLYYRPSLDDSQYAFPLDFFPIFDVNKKEVIDFEIPRVRRPISLAEPNNYHMPDIEREGGYRTDLKPINITQPEGVSFTMEGRTIRWQNWSIHIGFNYREGIVLNNITFYDKFEGKERPLFYRLSIAEMVVPYGNPEHPHHRKHAFDLGEYGAGNLTNSLSLGCDCKGAIHYMDAELPTQAGGVRTIKNAICIHEEDAGILFKHTDFRDESTIVTRGRKLIISQIFTAANYEYCIYWTFLMDGTVQLDVKLTGILNTTAMNPGEDLEGYGAEVYTGVNAHNHQHLFCLRVDPNIDGQQNTIFQSDAVRSPCPVGHEKNKWGNGFTAAKTKFTTVTEAQSDYDGATSRTWDIANENKINKHSKKPVSYKLVSRESAPLMPKEGSLVWKRAGFARHTVQVTKYKDDQLHPAGRHVIQTSGDPSPGLPAWIAENPQESIENTDVVLWHSFGITHFATPEDFPVMPAEPITLLLRPRNFFERNPCMDVPPSYNITPTQVKEGKKGCACAASKESVRV